MQVFWYKLIECQFIEYIVINCNMLSNREVFYYHIFSQHHYLATIYFRNLTKNFKKSCMKNSCMCRQTFIFNNAARNNNLCIAMANK